MLLVMGVTLYTSRIVLSTLGIDNFGIYNLVGGVVVLFTFLSAAMTTATQRFLCISIGRKDNDNTQYLFSSSIIAHILLIVLLIIIAETLGLWFIKTQLVIPPNREFAAHIVYQLSIIASVINVYRIPFNAAVLAHERMSFYAYSGIVEVLLKLAILWPLTICNIDKLILYGYLIVGINLIMLVWYIFFSHYKLPYSRHTLKYYKKNYVIDIFKFAGWSSFSAIANISTRQGLNILINIFYGVGLNATIGIMNQVASSIYQFIGNFQSAINPPIMKEYATGDYNRVRALVITTSKFSFFLLALLATPIIFNIDSILHIWLEDVPYLTNIFCVFALISLLPNTIGGPIWTVLQASGEIRKYQITISIITILNIPLFYSILYLGLPPQYTIIIQFATNLIVVFIGAQMGLSKIGMTIGHLTKKILFPNFGTIIIIWTIIYIIRFLSNQSSPSDLLNIMLKCCIDLIISLVLIYSIGLNHNERNFLKKFVTNKILKK